jgi:hypothetical protein
MSWLRRLLCGLFSAAALSSPLQAQHTASGAPRGLWAQLATKCSVDRADTVSQADGTPTFVVSPLGDLLTPRVPSNIDEGQGLRVIVLGDKDLIGDLRVRRISDLRQSGVVAILGAAEVAARLAAPPNCGRREFNLPPTFAPPKGEFEISLLVTPKADGAKPAPPATDAPPTVDYTEHSLGKVAFPINPLYRGALTFGPLLTWLEDPEFGILVNGTDSTLRYTSNPDTRVQYGLMLTLFPKARDILKGNPVHLSPTFGVVLNDLPNSVLAGLTADVRSLVFLTGGVHAGRVRELDEGAEIEVGDPISGGTDAIPVNRRRKANVFAAVSFDLRAVSKILSLALKAFGA